MLTVMGCMLCCVDSKEKGWCGVLTVKTWCAVFRWGQDRTVGCEVGNKCLFHLPP